MKDSVLLEGKIYISSRRAAEISHYTTDYVGQLCRSGKVDCRIVGRAWFVTEESILAHQKFMASSLTNGFSQALKQSISEQSLNEKNFPPTPAAPIELPRKLEKSSSWRMTATALFVVFSMILLGSTIGKDDPQLAESVVAPVSQVMGQFVTPVINPVTSAIASTPIPAGYASVSDAFAYGWNGLIGGVSSGILSIINLGTVVGGQSSSIAVVNPTHSASSTENKIATTAGGNSEIILTPEQ